MYGDGCLCLDLRLWLNRCGRGKVPRGQGGMIMLLEGFLLGDLMGELVIVVRRDSQIPGVNTKRVVKP
jgi:hypothetical protein